MTAFKMDDYVDVAQRIADFYERHPDGSLRSGSDPSVLEIGGKSFLVYHAQAWRKPDDPCPADGWAWEPVPGPTPYTKDSELMNAETSAWGRAIVACGFGTKKIASAQEVRNRTDDIETHEQFANLTKKLLAAAEKLGALPATKEAIAKNAAIGDRAGHMAWLQRCLATAEANLAEREKSKASPFKGPPEKKGAK